MKLYTTYVIINGYLLQQINIQWYGKYSQYSLLDHPDLNEIAIETYKQ